jgi:hypothetical protein
MEIILSLNESNFADCHIVIIDHVSYYSGKVYDQFDLQSLLYAVFFVKAGIDSGETDRKTVFYYDLFYFSHDAGSSSWPVKNTIL